jgi:hypothetical protein
MKRFTDTDKWADRWFRKLPPEMKCFWFYVLDRCDLAGAWKVDLEAASFAIGHELTEEEIFSNFDGRFKKIRPDLWYVSKFISFQYGELSEECRPHAAVIRSLKSNGLWKEYSKGIQRDKDKDKDKEEDQEKEKDQWESEGLFKRAGALFRRRRDTPLDKSEARAWKDAKPIIQATTAEDWALLEWAYSQTDGEAARWRRTSFATLLNNWNGEIEKAKEWKAGGRNGNGHLSPGAKMKAERSRGQFPENINVPTEIITND